MSVTDSVKARNREFMDAYARGDASSIARMYSASACLFPPSSAEVSGPAIEQFWGAVMGMGIKTVELETSEVNQDGGIIYETGHYRLAGADGKQLDAGKYLVVWKDDGGTLKLHRDIWNSSVSAPQ